MYPAGIGGDKYKAIGDFLARAAAAHLNPPKMKDMLLSRGALSEGEDPQARSGVIEMLKDQIPFLEQPTRLLLVDFSEDYNPAKASKYICSLLRKIALNIVTLALLHGENHQRGRLWQGGQVHSCRPGYRVHRRGA